MHVRIYVHLAYYWTGLGRATAGQSETEWGTVDYVCIQSKTPGAKMKFILLNISVCTYVFSSLASTYVASVTEECTYYLVYACPKCLVVTVAEHVHR